MSISRMLLMAFTIGAICIVPAFADVVGVDLGTGLPPETMGGFSLTPYDVGTIAGEDYTAHIVNGDGSDGWATWGQNYTGPVHVSLGADPLTLILSGVKAVYFYEEPNQFSDFYMTATEASGISITTLINGYHGSSGIGFYGEATFFL